MSKLRTVLVFVTLFAASAASGALVMRRHSRTADEAIDAAVDAALLAAREGNARALWEDLAPETRELCDRAHARMKVTIDCYAASEGEPDAPEQIRLGAEATAAEHGMSCADLARTTPESLWEHETVRRLGSDEQRRRFETHTTTEFSTDGTRAVVRLRLSDGTHQGFDLVLSESRWWLVDFHPYRDVAPAPTPTSN